MPKPQLVQKPVTPRKVFAFNTVGQNGHDPIPFELNGHTFHLRAFVPGVVFLEFAALAGQEDKASEALLQMLQGLLVTQDWERFMEVARDPDERIGVEQLGELFEWAVEVYGNRPTEPSSS